MSTEIPLAPANASPLMRGLVFLVPLALLASALIPSGKPQPAFLQPFMLLLAAGLTLLFAFAPGRLKYHLSNTALTLHTLLSRTELQLAGMRARKSAGRLGFRLFGTGLPGYLTGTFSFGPDEQGTVQAVASRANHGVIVEAGGRAYFLTPADPDTFLLELQRRGAQVTR